MAEYLDVLRTEKKYLIPDAAAGQIQARLSWMMNPDSHCRDNEGYTVQTLYFDSLYNKDYQEKRSGLEVRKKIRLRRYSGGGVCKLEWKQKQGEKQRKRSLLVTETEAEALTAGNYEVLLYKEDDLSRQFYTLMSEQVYRPCTLVEYKRFAYVEPTNDIRITFDRDIRASEGCFNFAEDQKFVYPVQSAGKTVLEIKYNHFLLEHIQTALASFGLKESANSKYVRARHFGLGVDTL